MIELYNANRNFYKSNGNVNRHNSRYRAKENPHFIREHHTQYQPKNNVLTGIVGQRIIGPFFIEGNLNADSYLELLKHQIVSALAALFPNPSKLHCVALNLQ